jgi:hypothetical protein
MGLDSCWIEFAVLVLDRPEVKAELGFPADGTSGAPVIVACLPRKRLPRRSRAPDIVSWRT